MSSKHIKANVILEEIRKVDGAQKYRFGPNIGNVIWLTGWNRAERVKVGDRGDLIYKVTRSYGLWFFHPYPHNNPLHQSGESQRMRTARYSWHGHSRRIRLAAGEL